MATEADTRVELINSFLKSPHRKIEEVADVHSSAREKDPLLYMQFGAWYFKNGEIRDHKIAFVSYLLTGDRQQHRDEGYMLLKELQPYEAERVLKWIKEHINKLPRSARTAFVHYIRGIENNNKKLERALVRQKNALKTLYASLHIRPCELSKKALFENNPPEGTMPFYVKELSKAKSSGEQARLIAKHRIPFTIAVSAIKKISPAVLVALIETMSSQEVVNNLGMIKRYGAFENEEVKELVEKKIAGLKKSRRASTMKTRKAIAAVDLDEETKEKLDEVTEQRLKAKGTIKRPTAMFIDKSGSMVQAIEIAKQLGSMISNIIVSDFHIYAFDTAPVPIIPGKTISDWERAFEMIVAGGQTSIGAPMRALRESGKKVEQLIIITDEHENHPPYFLSEYKKYAEEFGAPDVTIVRCGIYTSNQITNQLIDEKLPVQGFDFSGDFYALPNVIPLLTKPGSYELLEEIMATDVPMRVRA